MLAPVEVVHGAGRRTIDGYYCHNTGSGWDVTRLGVKVTHMPTLRDLYTWIAQNPVGR